MKLEAQTITFASKPGETTIGVSDDEIEDMKAMTTYNGYIFSPSYLNEDLTVVTTTDGTSTTTTNSYVLNTAGSAYDIVPAAGEDPVRVSAFRPYFTKTVTTSLARPTTRSIIFSNDNSDLKGVEEKGDPDGDDLGKLKIYTRKHKIFVESALNRDIDIRILNAAGITISTFTLEPGETVETRIINAGVYIVQSTDGRYIKKLAVK